MARRPTLRQRIDTLIASLEPEIGKAFIESINAITSDVVLKQVIEALERRDIEAAVRALNIDAAAFRPVERAVALAFESGGVATVGALPALRDRAGAEVIFRFDIHNPPAERWLGAHAAELVQGLADEARLVARATITEGYAAGNGPRKIGLDLVGRIDPKTGVRTGGSVGLTSQQQGYVANAREALLSGDPERMKHYFGLTRRDKRFDRTVLRAISERKALDTATVDRLTGRLSDSYLQLRGEMIGRTETLQAVMQGKHEAIRQAQDAGGFTDADLKKTWRDARDSRVRHTHAALGGTSVFGLETPFVSPSGAQMKFPGDTSLGAGLSEIIGCRCDVDYDFDYSARVD